TGSGRRAVACQRRLSRCSGRGPLTATRRQWRTRPAPAEVGKAKASDGAHSVMARVVLQLSQAERLHQRGHIHPEPAPKSFLQSVPPTDRIALRAAPSLDSVFLGRL